MGGHAGLVGEVLGQLTTPFTSLLSLLLAALVVETVLTGRVEVDTGGARHGGQWAPEWLLPVLVVVVFTASWAVSNAMLVLVEQYVTLALVNKGGAVFLTAWVYGRRRTGRSYVPGTLRARVVLLVLVVVTAVPATRLTEPFAGL